MYWPLRFIHRALGKVHWALALVVINERLPAPVCYAALHLARPVFWAATKIYERVYAIGYRRLMEAR